MNPFDHEKLDVYKAAIEFAILMVAMLTRMAQISGSGSHTGSGSTNLAK